MDKENLSRQKPRSTQRIGDPELGQWLIGAKALHFLSPFLGRENTLSGAARELGVSLPRLHHHVRRFLDGGVLRVARRERRKGRAVLHYRSTADAFYVPFRSMGQQTVEGSMRLGDEPWLELFLKNITHLWYDHPGEWGVWVEPGEGGVRVRMVQHPEQTLQLTEPHLPAVLLGQWVSDLWLEFADAKAFQAELQALVGRYLGRGGSQRYIFQTRLAPLLVELPITPKVTSR